MASGRYELVLRGVGRLWRGGSASGLGASQLLERFAVEGDAAAFEALVGRHGPMVLGTCRRMLADPHDVDDAFQATFLVLARKAGSIQDADRLGPWLHGVARRVAARSRALSSRRRSLEQDVGDEPAAESPDLLEGFEIRAALDEELARLPEKYRAPLVLCYLEGLTHDEAADQLRWPVGTVRSRLAGGRDRLRARLTRRGLAPSAAMPALFAKGALSPILLARTIRVATSAGSAPAHVATLAKGALIAMTWNKLKVVAALGLTAGLTAGGAGVAAQLGGVGKADVEVAKPSAEDRTRLDVLTAEVKSIEDAIPGFARQLENAKRDRNQRLDLIAALKKKLGIEEPADLTTSAVPDPAVPATLAQIGAEIGRLRTEARSISQKVKEMKSEHEKQLGPLMKAYEDLSTRDNALSSRYGELSNRRKKIESEATQADVDDRIKRLEKQIADQQAVIRNLQGRSGPGEPSPAPTPLAKPVVVEPKKSAVPLTLELGGSKILIISSEQGRATVIDTVAGTVDTRRFPKGVTDIWPAVSNSSVASNSVVGLILKGPEIRQVAAFDIKSGQWYAQDLREPTMSASPAVGTDVLYYHLGRFIYVFSAPAKMWGVLEMPLRSDPSQGYPSISGVQNGKLTVADGDLIHIFDTKTGEWTHINIKDDK